jgi:hypothetical protein
MKEILTARPAYSISKRRGLVERTGLKWPRFGEFMLTSEFTEKVGIYHGFDTFVGAALIG